MKRKVFKLCMAVLMVTALAACSKGKAAQGGGHQKSFDDLMTSVCSIYDDSTITEFSEEKVNDLLNLEDSLRRYAVYSEGIDSVLESKSFGLHAINKIVSEGYIKDLKSLEAVVDKLEHIEFEFHTMENDSLICYNLLNCFLPSNHESIDPRGDFFDFYVYLDKKTGECKRISCILPQLCDQCEKAPTFYVFLKKDTRSKDSDTVDDFEVTYSDETQCWTAVNDGTMFPKLKENSQLYFFTADDDGIHEMSCINLRLFHSQLKNFHPKG